MFMCDRTCDLFKVGNFNIKRCLLFLVCIMLLGLCMVLKIKIQYLPNALP